MDEDQDETIKGPVKSNQVYLSQWFVLIQHVKKFESMYWNFSSKSNENSPFVLIYDSNSHCVYVHMRNQIK